MAGHVGELLDEGHAALRVGDGAGARRAFELALAESPTTGEVIEGLARAAYLELDFARAIEDWERAYAAYREAGDPVGAVRVARQVAYMYGAVMGDAAVMNGWIARAQTLLPEAGESAEAGWVSLNKGMFEGDRSLREDLLGNALEIARRFGDRDLEFVSLAYLGASIVHDDRTDEGMALLDEALAAVAGGEVDDFSALEEIFCQLFSACEHAHDVARADQWIRVGDAIAQRRNLPAVSAFCRTHYGGVLTAAGRWPEADATLTEAVRLWGLGFGSMRDGALVRLADLRVRQGRFEEAERLLDGLDVNADTAHSLAAIHLARGDMMLARDVLERALDELDAATTAAVPLLAVLVEVHIAAGAPADANAAAETIVLCASGSTSDYLAAAAALARGRICLAAGTGDPKACLREAQAAFSRAQMPMEVARCRLELARGLAAERPEVAIAEARAALGAFEQLQAGRDVDATAALLRSLGARAPAGKRGDGVLTKREAEVLTLLGLGLSNPEISDRLYISRKTVEHHVGNILAKLGLRSRGEAAAYAVREKQAVE